MHLKNIKIVDSFNITGRGKVLVTDLDYDKECHRFFKGDTLRVEDKIYEILAVESILKTGGQEFVGLISKEISNKELFTKITFKDKSKTMEDVEWRIRNRWWLKYWKKIQIFYLVCIDKFKKK